MREVVNDVLIVGGGSRASPARARLRGRGLRPLVLEGSDRVGGVRAPTSTTASVSTAASTSSRPVRWTHGSRSTTPGSTCARSLEARWFATTAASGTPPS